MKNWFVATCFGWGLIFCTATSCANVANVANVDISAVIAKDDVAALMPLIGNEAGQIALNGRDGVVPLILAAQKNASKTLQWLLAQGADIEVRSRSGSTALSMAAYYGHNGMVAKLASAGAKLGAKSPNGYQPLDWALDNKKQDVVETLVLAWGNQEAKLPAEKMLLQAIQQKRPSNTRFQDGFSSFALLLAVVKGDELRLAGLLKRGFNPNQQNAAGYAALPMAARLGNGRMVDLLLAHKADPNIGGSKGNDVAGALNQAARGLNVDAAKRLILAGARVNQGNAKGITPLYLCAVADEKSGALTRLLLSRQAQIRQKADDGYDTLDAAMENRNRLFVQIAMESLLMQSLTDGRQKAQVQGWLERASAGGLSDLAGLSKESGVLLLNYAVVKGDAKLFSALMQTKPNLNAANRSGHAPLSLAASWSEADMLRQLLAQQADVDWQNVNRYHTSALMESTRNGDIAIVRMLLNAGAKVNLLDVHRDHALNWAVFYGRAPVVQLLLENQADITQIGEQTQDNPMDIALRQQVPEVIALLTQAGAKASKGGDGK